MNKKGFTLVEIMIVVGIISLLALIIVPNIQRSKINANESKAQVILKNVSNALESYYTYNNKYPDSVDKLLTENPPYLRKDYFKDSHNGYNFKIELTDYTYEIMAKPIKNKGIKKFKMKTGSVLKEIK